MFTIKYRSYEPAPTPADCTAGGYTPLERIDGPFQSVSTHYDDGYLVVSCERDSVHPGMTYGPVVNAEPTPEEIAEFEKACNLAGQGRGDVPPPLPLSNMPRPTLWVMNEHGATIAKYDL